MDRAPSGSSSADSHFVEVCPNGRYGRYGEVICRYNSKTVYGAFDQPQGIEVAWNHLNCSDLVRSSEDLQRLHSEIRQAKNLKHDSIMKFHNSWVDDSTQNINFMTEMFISTLRQYRQKHKRVSVWTVKYWCSQILKALSYLHRQDPPVVHRHIRTDNIFIDGATGKVKIGDLGLSGIVQSANFAVTELEFMAPETHEETYNELADIYSFGMCVLEMVTSESPYSECADPFEFFDKLRSGQKPAALYRVNDPELRDFIDKCIAPVSLRLSANALLKDSFLRNVGGVESDFRMLDYSRKIGNGGEDGESSDEDETETGDAIRGFSSMDSGWITGSVKFTSMELERLEGRNGRDVAGARPSERNGRVWKPQDSVTNNLLGIKASVGPSLPEKYSFPIS